MPTSQVRLPRNQALGMEPIHVAALEFSIEMSLLKVLRYEHFHNDSRVISLGLYHLRNLWTSSVDSKSGPVTPPCYTSLPY